MKSIVVFDSLYGNTAKIAEAIAKVLGCKAIKANDAPKTLQAHAEIPIHVTC